MENEKTMEQHELDRYYHLIQRTRQELANLDASGLAKPEEIHEFEREIRMSEAAFAAEAPGAWVAIVCRDYESRGLKYLLPVSRYRGIRTHFDCYNFGRMCFTIWKKGSKSRGVIFVGEHVYDLSTMTFSDEPFSRRLAFGHGDGTDLTDLRVFASLKEAEEWLDEQSGEFLEDILQADPHRIQAKLDERES